MGYFYFTIGTTLDTSYRLFLNPPGSYNLGTNTSILKMRKLKLKEIKELVPVTQLLRGMAGIQCMPVELKVHILYNTTP